MRLGSTYPSLIFVHMRKSGGMTFAAITERQFSADEVYKPEGSLEECRQELRRLAPEQRDRLRCIHGHVPFGLDDCLPGPVAYVTLLRDPVERILSVYYYALRRPEWKAHENIHKHGLSLDEFVASEFSSEFHNQQTQILSGSVAPFEDAESLARAKENLDRFVVAGLTERFDETLMMCRRRLGWKRLHYSRRNVNRRRPGRDEIPASTLSLIEEKNAADIELYDEVRRRFEETMRKYPELDDDCRRFQRWNRLYGPAEGLLRRPALLKQRLHDLKRAREGSTGRQG